jgi:hypothetical protein
VILRAELNCYTIDMIPYEPSGFAEKLTQRKESARQTLREASYEELRALVSELFPDGSHPWAESFSHFIEEHQAEPAVRGETSDGIAFVYYPRSNRGVWYERTGKALGVGMAGPAALKVLSEIVSETGHF